MSAIGRKFEVGGISKLFDLVIETTAFIVLSVPKHEIAVFHASNQTFTYHQGRLNLSLSYVQLLTDYYQVQLELLRSVDKDRVGTLQKGLEGGSEGKQKDWWLRDSVGRLDEFFDDGRNLQHKLIEEVLAIISLYFIDVC